MEEPTSIVPVLKSRAEISELSEDQVLNSPNQREGVAPLNSQPPGISLMVDLNDAGCRRRRRRQLSNLIQIYEDLSGEHEEEEAEPDSSTESIESSQRVMDEVRATLAISAQLNVNFLPDDERILKKMIMLESKEAALLREREGCNL